jgi:hypothetical protein
MDLGVRRVGSLRGARAATDAPQRTVALIYVAESE